MVDIVLIKLCDGVAYLRCIPDNIVEDTFYIAINLGDKQIISSSVGIRNMYVWHAYDKICSIYNETGTVPEHAISVWY